MIYFDFFSKYSDMFYYLTFLLGVTNISYNFFEYLSFSHKYDSSQLSKLEGRIHTRLNDIDNKIDMLYKIKIKLCEISHAVSDPDSETNSNSNSNSENEHSDYEIEEDSIENEDTDTNTNDKEELETIEELEASKEQEENVCVDQNDINDYYKDKFIKDKQSNSLSLSGVFRGWY